MLNIRQMQEEALVELEPLYQKAISLYDGSPESLGELLHDAVMRIPFPGQYSDKFRQECVTRRLIARQTILDFMPAEGRRLIELEDILLNS